MLINIYFKQIINKNCYTLQFNITNIKHESSIKTII